jgi:hypothetical protein
LNAHPVTDDPPKALPPVASNALVKRNPDDLFRFGLEPEGLSAAMSLCKEIAETGMFSGDKDGKPTSAASLLVRLMLGRSLGVPAMVALVHIFEVYGRPAISSRLKVALCLRHPECEKFELVESDAKHAVYLVKRAGRPEKPYKFEIEQAITAKLVKPDSNWQKWPQRMCEARAASHGADVEFPDAGMGLPTLEEAEDFDRPGEMRGEVVLPKVPARDWAKEDAELRAELQAAAKSGDRDAARSARDKFKTFQLEAPEAFAKPMKDFYNALAAAAKAGGGAPATNGATKAAGTAAPAATSGPAAQASSEPTPPFGGP